MKSSHGSDEIFGVPPQMKLNPSSYPDEVGFHHEVISSHDSGIYSSPNSWRCQLRTDLVEIIPSALQMGFFLGRVDKKDANEMFGNQQDLKLYIGFIIS